MTCVPTGVGGLDEEAASRVAVSLKALADPVRLRIVSTVAASTTGEVCVCDLTELSALDDLSQPTVSHHLKVLRSAGILASERRGTWVHYRLAPGAVVAVGLLLDAVVPALLDPARSPVR